MTHCSGAASRILAWVALPALVAASAGAQETAKPPYRLTEERARCAAYDPLRQPFFGDLHVHTAFSFDARSQDTRNTPADAYRFARGERVGLQPFDPSGKPLRSARIDRPLDFTAVTDHAEMLGEVRTCERTGLPGSDSDMCWSWRALRPLMFGVFATRTLIARQRWAFCGEGGKLCTDAARQVWTEIRDAAEAAYDRSPQCSFTTFVGYEWTGSVGAGTNLHRNVIFRNARVPEYPVSWVETPSAVELWDALERDCLARNTGCDVLTIPHNSNLGSGVMFATASLRALADANRPVSVAEAHRRQRFEPLVEVMQHKGDSECLLGGDTTDEACGFEKLPYNSFAGVQRVQRTAVPGLNPPGDPLAPTRADMVREALKRGLEEEQRLGVNPLKYGLIGSTDTHLGTPGLVAESGHVGHGGAGMSAATGQPLGLADDLEFNPGGLAVVWAEENARDALFEAMLRRETYGTSGPRIAVRFFGGWDYPTDLCSASDLPAQGYARGVPMGSDLPARPQAAGAPRFVVSALQDPGLRDAPGTALERVQIVKGWIDAQGQRREKVFDVAGEANRASVDLATCERRGRGDQKLCAVWTDPEFDAGQRAFYYARVLENPSCRWSQLACVQARVDCSKPDSVGPGFQGCCAPDHGPVIQERAWTSPIWYRPGE
jgi:hypothetical protein